MGIKVKLIHLLMVFMFAAILMRCTEEPEDFTTEEDITYESEENLEAAFGLAESITNAGMKYIESINSSNGKVAAGNELSCASINFIGTKESGRLEVDYGTDGCTGPGGRLRRGKIIIEFTGNRFETGSVVYTVFQDFYLDSLKIDGNRKSENISTSIQNPKFDITVTNGKVTWPDNTFALWDTERTHSWTYSDDDQTIELSIEGVSYGTTKTGIEYTTEINAPLVFTSNCLANSNYIPVSGSKTIMLNDNSLDIYINYGNGQCDQEITVRVGNRSKTINI